METTAAEIVLALFFLIYFFVFKANVSHSKFLKKEKCKQISELELLQVLVSFDSNC